MLFKIKNLGKLNCLILVDNKIIKILQNIVYQTIRNASRCRIEKLLNLDKIIINYYYFDSLKFFWNMTNLCHVIMLRTFGTS